MEITINVNINAAALIEAIDKLCRCGIMGVEKAPSVKEKTQDYSKANELEKSETTDITYDKKVIEAVPVKEETHKYTLEEVRKALGGLAEKKGREMAKKLLNDFEVSKVTELDEGIYSSFMDRVKEVMKNA